MNYVEPFYFHGTSVNAGYTEEEIKEKARAQGKVLIEKLKEI